MKNTKKKKKKENNGENENTVSKVVKGVRKKGT